MDSEKLGVSVNLGTIPGIIYDLTRSLKDEAVKMEAFSSESNTTSKKLANVESIMNGISDKITLLEQSQTAHSSDINEFRGLNMKSVIEGIANIRDEADRDRRNLDVVSAGVARLDKDLVSSNADVLSFKRELETLRQNVSEQISNWVRSEAQVSEAASNTDRMAKDLEEVRRALITQEDKSLKRHESLHREMGAKIAAISVEQARGLNELRDLVVKSSDDRRRPQALDYILEKAQDLMANLKITAAMDKLKVRIIFAWHVQCLNSGKMKLGAIRIRHIFSRNVSLALTHWRYIHGMARITATIEDAVSRAVPDVPAILVQLGIPDSIEAVQLASTEQTRRLDSIKVEISEQESRNAQAAAMSLEESTMIIERNIEKYVSVHSDQLHGLEERVQSLQREAQSQQTDLKSSLDKEFLKLSTETAGKIQTLQTDVHVMWNSLKQMDSSKSDRVENEGLIRASVSQAVANEVQFMRQQIHELNGIVKNLSDASQKPRTSEMIPGWAQTDSERTVFEPVRSGSLAPTKPSTTTVGSDEIESEPRVTGSFRSTLGETYTTRKPVKNNYPRTTDHNRVPLLNDNQLHARGIHMSQLGSIIRRK